MQTLTLSHSPSLCLNFPIIDDIVFLFVYFVQLLTDQMLSEYKLIKLRTHLFIYYFFLHFQNDCNFFPKYKFLFLFYIVLK